MKAVSTAASATRHTVAAVSEAVLIIAVAGALAFAFAFVSGRPAGAGSAFAASGGQSGATSWITLSQVNGSTASVQPSLGGTVAFSTGYPSNTKNPRIEVLCYQSGALAYGEAGAVTDTFLLGGGGSIWLTNGGSASCTANLFYFGSHAGHQTYNQLATMSFSAGG
jgi:hypothetical protein